MLKQLITVFTLILLISATSMAQWVNQGVWPPLVNDTLKGSTHGIAVDPDGKVWITNFFADDTLDDGTSVHSITVWNADGTPASFSPIKIITTGGGFVVDTLKGADHRGLGADDDGNILLTRSGKNDIFRINYQTGEGMDKGDLSGLGTSPSAPAVDAAGNVYVAPVVGNGVNPIIIYNKDLTFQQNAVDLAPGIGRDLEVSADGNTIYWMPFTLHEVIVYNRPDEFSPYDSVATIVRGLEVEAAEWNNTTGLLWMTSRDVANTHPDTVTSWSTYYCYAYDPASGNIVDSLKWDLFIDNGDTLAQKLRAIDFSPDGNTAYLGCFETSLLPACEKVVKTSTGVWERQDFIADDFSLSQNYPNPFNPTTTISFTIPNAGFVTLKVYDMLGQEVAVLVNDDMTAGQFNVTFDASNLSSGTYVYELNTSENRISKKMILMK